MMPSTSSAAPAKSPMTYAWVLGSAKDLLRTWFKRARELARSGAAFLAWASAILSSTSAYLITGEASVWLVSSLYFQVYFLPSEVKTIPVPLSVAVELSSRRLSSSNQLGCLQMMGLIFTNILRPYCEARAAFTPGFIVAAWVREKMDSEFP